MPKCTNETVRFGKVGRRIVQAAFDGGDIVSEGGAPLLRLVDERIGLTRAAAQVFADGRRAASVRHSMCSLLAQRVYGLCCGWEDVSDHNTLRHDLALQTAVGRAEELASAPTLSRLETSATMAHAAALHGVLLDQFIASHKTAPDELVLDIDATHMPLYGQQEGAHFHAHWSIARATIGGASNNAASDRAAAVFTAMAHAPLPTALVRDGSAVGCH
jgi:hypothetical protein